jgi:hypothetical protein
VEHVTVNDGGQGIVGEVTYGARRLKHVKNIPQQTVPNAGV